MNCGKDFDDLITSLCPSIKIIYHCYCKANYTSSIRVLDTKDCGIKVGGTIVIASYEGEQRACVEGRILDCDFLGARTIGISYKIFIPSIITKGWTIT